MALRVVKPYIVETQMSLVLDERASVDERKFETAVTHLKTKCLLHLQIHSLKNNGISIISRIIKEKRNSIQYLTAIKSSKYQKMIHNYALLTNGARMPVIGLGTSGMDDPMELKSAMESALRSGYRHFDTAYLNKNERIVGKVMERWISRGLLKREELFITAKLPMAGVHPDRVEIFLNKSLKNLDLDYVDLYLIQFPVCLKYDELVDFPINETGELQTEATDLVAVWQKMEEQTDSGKARAIGLSNFTKDQIFRILEIARIKPVVIQIEIHPYLQNSELVDFCRKKDINVVACSPLGNPGINKINEKRGLLSAEVPIAMSDQTLAFISKKHSKTPAQIMLRFLIQMGLTAIPKSVTSSRIEENIDIFGFELDERDMNEFKNLDRGNAGRINHMACKGLAEHPEFPFK